MPDQPDQASAEPDLLSSDRSEPHPPLPRDKRGWQVSPAPDGRGMPEQTPSGPPAHRRPGFLWFVVILIAINWISVFLFQPTTGEQRVTVPFSPYFLEQVKTGNVKSISSKGDTVEGNFKTKLHYPPSKTKSTPTKLFATQVPSFWNGSQLSALLQEKGVEINAKSTTTSQSLLAELLLGFGPTLLIVGLFVMIAKRAAKAGGGMGALGSFGKSQARRVDPDTIRVTFADVAGIDEAKAELSEIVDFLRNPDRYGSLGGRMPHGVLLSGAPGTGKTLLARAVAGEAHAAFFSISASEFIEAIVGVGASRVRDLFAKAKEAAPAIIFIDELDAIGRSRQGSVSVTGANDEREQTLDQILTEIDGFESSEAVIVLAATNRPDVLDPALLRAGRFDRRVTVQAPDRKGRKEILEVHTRSIPLDPSVELDAVAASTPGMVGADLANLANEAALLAARRGHEKVQMADITDSLEKIMLGSPRGILLSPADRERTAYHEAGHAVIGRVLTLPCGGATIKADYDDGKAGHAITEDPYVCIEEWRNRGKVRDNQEAVWHARIMTYMAGAEAEMELLGSSAIGDGNDRYQIAMMAEELSGAVDWDKLEPRLRAMTRMLVRRHRVRIERVAQDLL
ncbi:MAG TPA: ATP-dependent metallopeptidase FtsH/Yme1/Tma family protein, partial [Solirubrobacteraceae bacterium]